MTVYESRLERREQVAEGTMAFHFEKPTGFTFKPGQAINVVLQSERHAFSIVTAPFEADLVIATRLRDSSFKRSLGSLPIGSPAKLAGPFGSFALHQDRARPAVFIAGGIGITPFISILRQAAKDQLPQRLSLLYSNRRPEDAAFLDELQHLERQNKNFRLVATMTRMDDSSRSWQGETGSINEKLVRRASGERSMPIYYLVGPPAMVAAMRDILNGMGINDNDIRSEEFFGY